MSPQSPEQEFRDLSVGLKWVIWTTYLAVGVFTFHICTKIIQMAFLDPNRSDLDFFEIEIYLNIIDQEILITCGIILCIASLISFMIWMYNAAGNARTLGANDLPTPMLWGVLSKLIPFINLWTPFKAIRDIYKASQNPSDWQSAKVPLIFGAWWISSILSFGWVLFMYVISMYIGISYNIFSIAWISIWTSFEYLLWIIVLNISFITSVSVAKRITRNQNDLQSRIAFD